METVQQSFNGSSPLRVNHFYVNHVSSRLAEDCVPSAGAFPDWDHHLSRRYTPAFFNPPIFLFKSAGKLWSERRDGASGRGAQAERVHPQLTSWLPKEEVKGHQRASKVWSISL